MGATRFNNTARQTASVARKDILASAIQIFAAQGYHEATIRTLADANGIRPASIYYHFRDKEEILRSIIADASEALLEELSRCRGEPQPVARLKRMVDAHLRFTHAHANETKIILEQSHLLTGEHADLVRQRQISIFDAYRQVIAELFRETDQAEADPGAASFVVLSIVNGFARWARPDGRRDVEQQIAQVIGFVLSGLRVPDGSDEPRPKRTRSRERKNERTTDT